MKILDFFKRWKKGSAYSSSELFKLKYQSFKNLLDNNNDSLEAMTRMEAKLEGDFLFDLEYIRSRSTAILQKLQVIVQEINFLGDNRYIELMPIFENIEAKIREEIAGELPADIVPLVLPLDQVDRRFLPQVGAKNANLGDMKNRLHLPTPDGFVLTNEAYRLILAENLLNDKLAGLLQELNPDNLEQLTDKSRILKELILDCEIPGRLSEEVIWHYHKLVETLGYEPQLAIRSSGLYEDQEYSFAGQFLTLLNVPINQFFSSYLAVLASQFSPNALVYLGQKRLAGRELAMSVGCLTMVPARASGVMFTRDPLGDRENVLLIDAAWGLGPAVVDGTVTPDHYVLAKSPEITLLEQQIHDKSVLLTAATDSTGIIQLTVEGPKRNQSTLTETELLELTRYGCQLEDHFGGPQDVEWAIDQQGRILLMQSRPLARIQSKPRTKISSKVLENHPVLIDNGTVACFGVASGPVFIVQNDADLVQFPEGAILVARHTSARYGMVIHKAQAMLVDIGSATSHLAILAREFKVPSLVDIGTATEILQNGQVITVDANRIRVYEGRVEELMQAHVKKTSLFTNTPIYSRLRRVLRWITPLHLTDPKLSTFAPSSCRTLHDICRFAHEMAIKEMFELAEKASRGEIHTVQLKTKIPFNLHIIDLGDGIQADRRAKFVPPEAITSIPMQALWRGISHPDICWAGPIPIDVKGLYSVVSRSLTAATPQHSDFWSRTFAILSHNYLNFSSRLGYHFATIDAFVSDVRNDNYISFRFKGGAADEQRRGRRARFLGAVVEKLDFEVEVTGDLVVAKLWKYPRELMEEKLDLLGKLMGCARQRDMVMGDDVAVQWHIKAFLEGNYGFNGEFCAFLPTDSEE